MQRFALIFYVFLFFFSSRRRHTRSLCDWSSDVCSSDLEGYEEDITRLARHCAKVMLSFALLEKRSMPLAELPAYVARVPILAELNSRYLRMTPAAMAEWLLNDLERAGAVRRNDGRLYATGN